ncbi:unnamed protein product, partial [Sphacelaria rigidula]
GLLRGHIRDGEGVKRLVRLSFLVAPGLGRNLFSVKQATRNCVVSIFETNNPRLETNEFTIPLQELESDLYFFSLELSSGNDASGLAMQAADAATLWHRRMGHLNSNTVPGCDICAVGKSHQLVHPKTANNVQLAFQLVITDLMGPIMPEALAGLKYVCKISDEYTRWTEIYLQKTKDDTLHAFQSYIQSMDIRGGVRVKRLRADKSGEFIGNEFRSYCHNKSACQNASPHSALDMQSRHKMLKETESDLKHLQVVGARVFVHIERHTSKLALEAAEGRLVGYSNDSKTYRDYNPATRRIIESRNVVF